MSFINICFQHSVKQLSKAREDHDRKLVEMVLELQDTVRAVNDKLNALSSRLEEQNRRPIQQGEFAITLAGYV